jgi:uncharacterized protein YcaQ
MLIKVDKNTAKNIWIRAQKLDVENPFGKGAAAVAAAVSHLGYVQIDTINVIERCHHHILFNRIPAYRRKDLHRAQSVEKSVFEYWTHALAYVPTSDFRYFVSGMKNVKTSPGSWFSSVTTSDYRKVKKLLQSGPLSIRDIKDDVLVAKEHDWASPKPSKKALQLGFHRGEFVVGERVGMLKKYDLTERHFGWSEKPAAATEAEYNSYVLDRALRSQGIVSLDSICHLDAKRKAAVLTLIEKRVAKDLLVEVVLPDSGKNRHWASPEVTEGSIETSPLTHILSPFDPLVIQRKRLKLFFDHDHLFEAYVPKEKRVYGYFSLPVLSGNNIIALLDLKTDRAEKKLHIQAWHWLGKNKSLKNKKLIETALDKFGKFQLAAD